MTSHSYRTLDVPVEGGNLRVAVWDPVDAGFHEGDLSGVSGVPVPNVLLIHGVTASHLAWPFIAAELPGVRVIAPDLRGRGASNALEGAGGIAAHASDLVATLDFLGISSLPVIGHSMGGFVALVLGNLAPERVDRLVLIDGGLPLDAPAGVSAEELVQSILGATAARLSMRFADVEAYRDFWREHPAFQEDWSDELEAYFAYDLVPDGEGFRPATSLKTTTDDTVDLNTGSALAEALIALPEFGKPINFITVPRGLANEAPGLYAPEYLEGLLEKLPCVQHTRLDDLNHYTVVMSERGAAQIGELLRSWSTKH